MALQIGIVGLPNVGKSTLFNALTRSQAAQAANFPFCTIEPNVGIVEVPDPRLQQLAEIANPEKVIPATVRFVDIAGLVKGASEGEGLGNQFLHHIREVDAICEVVRLFEDGNIIHVEGSVDGKRDIATIEMELILADLQTVENRIKKVQGGAKTGNKENTLEYALALRVQEALNRGQRASSISVSEEEELILRGYQLLTCKPFLYAANVAEDQLASIHLEDVQKQLGVQDGVVALSARIEEELGSLPAEEAREYLVSLGVSSSGLDQLIHAAYDLLGLQTYFTAGPKEVRAWTIPKGATAPEAAGVIHSDFQKGFIRAETISYTNFVQCGGEAEAKATGKMRSEGKEYVVQDGDVMLFRFHV